MNTLDKLDWEILNATADDCENLEQIYHQVSLALGGERRQDIQLPLLSELADRIRSLVEKDWLEAVMDENGRSFDELDDLSYVWRAWFQMTPEGKAAWESTNYLARQD